MLLDPVSAGDVGVDVLFLEIGGGLID
ncbi:hypothetical protein CGLO_00004 [Colletotrichum gloeosporioides Cg-14]|uniref:Uncharacterized protein n=1 Tax=Colletotrichum gloeosporioides (strain Cg-14) TaxID=1237896 RepID=T0MEP5_COLGC|nr:hypothetical protein CGLO_00004 [Colletotrichum gloeosporioides Cg-14]